MSKHSAHLQAALFLLTWLILIAAPLIGFASIPAVRYFVPVAAPLALLVGCGAMALAHGLSVLRWAVGVVVVLWLGGVGVPFAYSAVFAPPQLPLTGNNQLTYFGDLISADQAVRMTAAATDTLDPRTPLYADWQLCRLLYFYSSRPVDCLASGQLQAHGEAAVSQNSRVYVIAGYTLDPAPGFCLASVSRFSRPNADPIIIWRVERPPC